MNAIPQQKWAQINEARQNEGNPDQVPVYARFVFADLIAAPLCKKHYATGSAYGSAL